jgi:signal transduction histidine kinase
MRRLEALGIAAVVVALVAVPTAVHGWPTTLLDNLFTALLLVGGLALAWWRRPRLAGTVSLACFLASTSLGDYGWFPGPAFGLFSLSFAVLALGWSGRAAWLAALLPAAYLVPFYYLSHIGSLTALLMFTVPPYVAGTVFRQRRETSDELAVRARELDEERELFAELALRHERARIAAELHDIIGHAISVMVIQAAAGQRLVDADPAGAKEAFAAIADSARQGKEDLQRLVELLGGSELGGPDLALVDEVVSRASRSGLNVTCRFEGDRDGVPDPVGHLAFRVVQESLTNALRYAPGADVRIVISVDDSGRSMAVRVENDAVPGVRPDAGAELAGTGSGLRGLRERIQSIGGQLVAGPNGSRGWAVEARLPGG